jgi:hypothetical protein
MPETRRVLVILGVPIVMFAVFGLCFGSVILSVGVRPAFTDKVPWSGLLEFLLVGGLVGFAIGLIVLAVRWGFKGPRTTSTPLKRN